MKFSLFNPNFFNRINKTIQLSHTLTRQNLRLTVMLGPPSSGKTALVRHDINQQNNTGPLFHPIRIDISAVDISAQDSLYSSILDRVTVAQLTRKNSIQSVEVSLPATARLTFLKR